MLGLTIVHARSGLSGGPHLRGGGVTGTHAGSADPHVADDDQPGRAPIQPHRCRIQLPASRRMEVMLTAPERVLPRFCSSSLSFPSFLMCVVSQTEEHRVSVHYKLSLFNAHTLFLIVHIFMNVNKLCLNKEKKIFIFLNIVLLSYAQNRSKLKREERTSKECSKEKHIVR